MRCQKGFFNHIHRNGFLESFQSLFLKWPVEFDIFQIKFGTKREISDLKLSHVENRLFNKKLWHLLNLKLGGYFSRDGGGRCKLSPPSISFLKYMRIMQKIGICYISATSYAVTESLSKPFTWPPSFYSTLSFYDRWP